MNKLFATMCLVTCMALSVSSPDVKANPSSDIALQSANVPEYPVSLSLQHEARAALDRAYEWLRAHQHEDGHWSNPKFPALTALPVWALIRSGEESTEPINNGVAYIKRCVHDNGAIFVEPSEKKRGGGLSNYNTAISMVALHETGRADLVPIVQRARAFVARSQFLSPDNLYHGGMGYDAQTDREYTDLSNSYIAYEAMRLTESVEDLRPADQERVDLDWDAALQFVQSVHNHPDYNDRPWVSDAPSEIGGFVYHPDQTRAGTYTDEDGIVRFRSMRGMTYAGLLSYIYADVDRNDPRVKATVDWAANHWSLEANNTPSGGDAAYDTNDEREGLFYLYNVMSKGLAAYGQNEFKPSNRPAFNWREDLVKKLVSMQRIDPETGHGYWVNEVSRYWEGDPVLVTSYAVIALQIALGDAAN